MNFDIDVSGSDLLSKNYTICIASTANVIIKGYKLNEEIVSILSSKYGQGVYRYKKSQKGKSSIKVRIYCIIIYYLFKSLNLKGEVSLNICRDFKGREDDIKKTLKYFLETLLGLDINHRFYFVKLSPDSNADKYAFLMRHDTKNQMKTYINISLEELERWLK